MRHVAHGRDAPPFAQFRRARAAGLDDRPPLYRHARRRERARPADLARGQGFRPLSASRKTARCCQLVDEEKRAWHAGKSYWRGITDVNSASVGIEIVNPGHEFGYRPFPDEQIASVIPLVADIKERHGIGRGNIVGHSDVAPARKEDPGRAVPVVGAGQAPPGAAQPDPRPDGPLLDRRRLPAGARAVRL